ncbi:hypothetical protein ABPG72_004013 [Tetrahymena utriculariae]
MAKTFLKTEISGNKNSTITEQVIKLYAIGEMAPSVLQGFASRYLNPLYVCPSLGMCPPYYHNLNVTAIAQNIIKDTSQINKPAPTLKKTFKFLHMSDLHFDGLCIEGANGKFSVPDCGSVTSGQPKDESAKAGYWGYLGNCDISFRTVEAAIRITDLLKKELPHIKVFPITGNHESFPVNVYDYFGDQAAEEYRQNGFYSSLITKYSQLLRVNQSGQKINCNQQNQRTKKFSSLDIFHQYILQKNGLKFTLHSSKDIQTSQFLNSMDTLKMNISVFRNLATNQINNVMFITGSLTSYGEQNPSFKMFEVDFDTLQPVNYVQYTINLTYNNENKIKDINNVIFERIYDFKSYYGYDDISNFEIISDFLGKLKTDLSTQNKYHQVSNALANPTNLTQVTLEYYCDTFTTPAAQSSCYGKPYKKDIIVELFGTWYSHNPNDLLFE